MDNVYSRTIWKFPIEITEQQEITVNKDYRVLSVGLDPSGQPCLWIYVDSNPNSPKTSITINLYGTGGPVSTRPGGFIGTFLQGSLVWHVFYGGQPLDKMACGSRM